jgi:pectate lyase
VRPLLTTLAAAALVAAGLTLPMSQAAAQTGTATGYATQNGGTTGGAGGQTVRATTGTQIHQALCNRPSTSTPIIIEVSGTINHGNTTKVSGPSCNTSAGVIELKEISNVTITKMLKPRDCRQRVLLRPARVVLGVRLLCIRTNHRSRSLNGEC